MVYITTNMYLSSQSVCYISVKIYRTVCQLDDLSVTHSLSHWIYQPGGYTLETATIISLQKEKSLFISQMIKHYCNWNTCEHICLPISYFKNAQALSCFCFFVFLEFIFHCFFVIIIIFNLYRSFQSLL